MLDWMKRQVSRPIYTREVERETPRPQGRAMSGKYLLLYKYLDERYANTVVLTFGEIEDLLDFSLPEQARVSQEWWTKGEAGVREATYSDAWRLAHRTAIPNLRAHTVTFERVA